MRIDPNLHSPVGSFDKSADASTEAELRALAHEFEAVLTAEILQSLSTSLSGNDTNEDPARSLEGIVWLELAQQLTSQRDLGLASSLYEQLSPPDSSVPASPSLEATKGHTPASTPIVEHGLPETNERLHPVHGRMSSPFGERLDPFNGNTRSHHGIDWAAPEGSPVIAAQAGRVVASESMGGYGNAVLVRHADGVETLYAHLSRLDVQPGDLVHRGQPLGTVGQTGRATGPHLHFEVRRDGRAENPESWLSPSTRTG